MDNFDNETHLDRHQSMMSTASTDSMVTSDGRLLDKLDFDEDLPWVNKDKNQNTAAAKRVPQRVNLSNRSGTQAFMNQLAARRDSVRYAGMSQDNSSSLYSVANTIDEDTSQTLKSMLGKNVAEVATSTVKVAHTNINPQAFAKATLEYADADADADVDVGVDVGAGLGPMDTNYLSPMHNTVANNRVSMVPVRREDPNETRVKKAMRLRREGKPRESSYELSIAAHHGSRNAMLLYGLALTDGIGLRKDEKQAFNWICKSIDYDPVLNANSNYAVDPATLVEDKIPKTAVEPDSQAYFALAFAYLKGTGCDKNEAKALQLMEKSASLGHVEAMTQAGLLWYKKGPNGRKKDLHRSAAWLRFADKRGADNIGNSWIYKDKYMKKK